MTRCLFSPFVAAMLGGVCYALGNLGYGLWPLAFVCLIPLWWALERCRSRYHAAMAGLVFGLSLYLIGFPWLLALQDGFLGGNPWIGRGLWLGLGMYCALGFAVYAFAYHLLRKTGLSQTVTAIALLVLLEFAQPNLFPIQLGTALLNVPLLVQLADLGGPLLLSALLATVNALLYTILRNRGLRRSALPQWGMLVFVMAISLAYGSMRLNSLAAAPDQLTLNIATIQSNELRTDPSAIDIHSHKTLLNMSEELLKHTDIDLLIWPESAYSRSLRRPLPLDAQLIRGDIDVALLFGGTSTYEHEGRRVSANSVFLADVQGRIDQAYDKSLLIPFAETLPSMLTPWQDALMELFPRHQHFRAGQSQDALRLGELRISTPICFEVIHSDYVRRMIQQGQSNLLVTLANDGWFGDSQAPRMHLQLARLRAIEQRIWVVRATNTGISAVIDPNGNIVAQTGLGTQETMVAPVQVKPAHSVYLIWGNWPAAVAGLSVLLGLARALLWHPQRRRLSARPVLKCPSKT